MFSYFIYNFILFNSIAFSYLAEYAKTKTSRVFCRILVFLGIFLPAALRYKVGYDYFNYANIYKGSQISGDLELGYTFLQNVAHGLSLDVQWIFVLSSLVMYAPICFGIGRRHYSIIVPCYVLCVYLESLSFIRQYMAVTFLICGLYYYLYSNLDKKSLHYNLTSLLFHYSSVLYLICYFSKKKVKLINPIWSGAIIILFYVLVVKFDLINAIFVGLGLLFPRYAGYQNSMWNVDTEVGSGLGVLARLLIPFCILLFSRKLLKLNIRNVYLVTLNVVYILVNILTIQVQIMGRLNSLFIFILLFDFCELSQLPNKYRSVILAFLFLITFFVFEKNIMSVYPYRFIF